MRLRADAPGWKSIKIPIGSWLLVAAFSTLGAALGNRLAFRFRT